MASGVANKVIKLDNQNLVVTEFESLTKCATLEGFSRCKLTNSIKVGQRINTYLYQYGTRA